MSHNLATRYLTPWKYRRALEAELRVQELRGRDGDDCRRCRRPLRFDLPDGHDQRPKIVDLTPIPNGAASELHNQCLCHARCNLVAADRTREVQERRRRENEAELFAASRKQRRRG